MRLIGLSWSKQVPGLASSWPLKSALDLLEVSPVELSCEGDLGQLKLETL